MASQDSWNGARTILAVNEHAAMAQTPNGTLVVGYLNQSTLNNQGEIAVTSGGGAAVVYPVPALQQMLSLLVGNWQADNLTITNTSDGSATPILVQAFGPGIPGATPVNLPIGSSIMLGIAQAAQGPSKPKASQLRFQANSGALTIVAVIGGPANPPDQNNAYVIALNAPDNLPRDGYYAVVTGNTYAMVFNWNAAMVYVANLSPVGAAPVVVTMTPL
ncbi:MAG: hypothetical protein EOP66_07930 [Sphingomonas sp.]|nr:MAG: hypothetical protein EOP66_07930 [Sphingomonas sp.]